MWTVYTKQFQGGVWATVIVISSVLTLSLHLVSRRSAQEHSTSFADSAFAIIGTLFGQGTTLRFQSTAGRTVVLTALLLQLVTLTFYTSNLVSALTVGPPLPPYEDLQTVYSESSLKLAFLRGGMQLEYFKNSDTAFYQRMWRSVADDDLVGSEEEGVARARRGGYAYLAWEIFFRLRYGDDCRLIELPASYFPDYASFAVTKNSPLVPVMNKMKWWKELAGKRTDCAALESAPVELKTILTPLLLVALASLTSLAVLYVERCLLSRHPDI
ncbi:glutamate receptor-like [Penaeus japonicus]|uniref:glutamate receptor-like n=1 Tax=Penaeus japonicus TaxID=27405 RepID=UPI001C70B341|nr:glutamate receptor-like [Penaeus japonicus]